MNNNIIGKREAMGSNSNKYGYSIDGMCVKAVGGGYRSSNGTQVHGQVSTDASCLVKENVYLNTVKAGQVIVFDARACKVQEVKPINNLTTQFKMLNLETGTIDEKVVDVADRIVAVIWDTFDYPEKKVDGGDAPVKLNEFTPAQLNELRNGSTTLAKLRTPEQADSLEDMLKGIVARVMGVAEPSKAEESTQA